MRTSSTFALRLLCGLGMTAFCGASGAYDFSAVSQQLSALVEREGLRGAALIILRDGAIIHEDYVGTYTASTRVPIASATKWLSALVLQRLVDRGVLRWSDTVGQYFPAAPTDKRNITVGQLFSHTSGFSDTWAPCLFDRLVTLDFCAQQILALPLQNSPGTVFAYGGNSMQVAGRIAEIATGTSWDELFRTELAQPLGMTNTDYDGYSVLPVYRFVSNPWIGGGARSTVTDYALVVQMIAEQGRWQGQPFLSPQGLREMQHDQTHGVPMVSTPDPLAQGYGYGEWIDFVDALGEPVQVSSTGAYGTCPWVDLETGTAAVLLVQGNYQRISADIRLLWISVRAIVLGHSGFLNPFGSRRCLSAVPPFSACPVTPPSTQLPK